LAASLLLEKPTVPLCPGFSTEEKGNWNGTIELVSQLAGEFVSQLAG
jgi:hypothetical protein